MDFRLLKGDIPSMCFCFHPISYHLFFQKHYKFRTLLY